MAAGTNVSPMHLVPVRGSPLQVTVKSMFFPSSSSPFVAATASLEEAPLSATNPVRTKASNSEGSAKSSNPEALCAARPKRSLRFCGV